MCKQGMMDVLADHPSCKPASCPAWAAFTSHSMPQSLRREDDSAATLGWPVHVGIFSPLGQAFPAPSGSPQLPVPGLPSFNAQSAHPATFLQGLSGYVPGSERGTG